VLPAGGRAAACPLPHTPGNIYGPDGLTEPEPFGCCVLLMEGSRGPARSSAGRGSCFANSVPQNVGNTTHVCALDSQRGPGGDLWPALATTTLATAIGFNVLALVIQFER
jgi:hypothetical protein